MRQGSFCLLACIVSVLLPFSASALERSDAKLATQLISKAQSYIQEHGVDKAIIEFNRLDGPFNSKSAMNPHGDLYLYTVDRNGFQSVHGKNPKIRGKVMLDMRDIDGVFIIRDLVKACFESKEGRGWTRYRWPNPVTKEVEAKQGYIERVPGTDFCIGTGIYQ